MFKFSLLVGWVRELRELFHMGQEDFTDYILGHGYDGENHYSNQQEARGTRPLAYFFYYNIYIVGVLLLYAG